MSYMEFFGFAGFGSLAICLLIIGLLLEFTGLGTLFGQLMVNLAILLLIILGLVWIVRTLKRAS